ncbi:MAG: FAD-binding oxidoreductase, partial [Novosphingobium sp.]
MLTERLDLRTGDTPWDDATWNMPAADDLPRSGCDVAIVGSGITGAILAERLSADGHSVVVLDRRSPGLGSTAASTAQIMWAMDVPLSELADRLGEAEATRRWTRVHEAVARFGERLDRLQIDSGRLACPTVYLEGPELDAAGLEREAALHGRNGLPSRFLDARATAERFDIEPRASIVSADGFALDPVKTCRGLLERARQRGAVLCYPQNVASIARTSAGACVSLEGGAEIVARHVVLATGYEKAELFLPPAFKLISTFVIATAPGVAPLWR